MPGAQLDIVRKHRPLTAILPTERLEEVSRLLGAFMPLKQIAEKIQTEWGFYAEDDEASVLRKLTHYKYRHAFVDKATRQDKAMKRGRRPGSYQTHVNVMQELSDLYRKQKERLEKALKIEKPTPLLMSSVQGEIRCAADILYRLGDVQMKTGVLPTAPKVVQGQITAPDGQTTQFAWTESDERIRLLIESERAPILELEGSPKKRTTMTADTTLLADIIRRLAEFGESGEAVVTHAATIGAREERSTYLKRAFAHFGRMVALGMAWTRIPVDIRTFLESPSFLDVRGEVYPAVMEELEELNNGTYTESVLTGSIGTGKALDVRTPIPTPSGFTLMGDLQAGDEVYTETGEICRVEMAHAVRHGRACYEVQFSDGSAIVADEEHLWVTQDRKERCANKPGSVRTTKELLGTLHHVDGAHSYKNHSIPLARPLVGKAISTNVNPYVLGVWLGDGTTENGMLTCADQEIIDEVRKHFAVAQRGPISWQPIALCSRLRQLGVLGNKHIPAVYFRASIEQRLALLQGLMDTDGTADRRNGVCSIVQKRQRLAEDIAALVRSLGMKPTIKASQKRSQNGTWGTYYNVAFTAYSDLPVFRLKRKRALLRAPGAQASRQRNRYITAIVPVPSRPVRCITVDNPTSLYLAGSDLIPTHNTTGAIFTQAYQLYVLSCMTSPQKTFRLAASSEVMIVIQSATMKLAYTAGYLRFHSLVSSSPYFQRYFPHNPSLKNEMHFPNRIIVRPLSGAAGAALGQNVIGGIIDEMSFMQVTEQSKQSADGTTYNQAIELYNAIARRRKSRFLWKGWMPGMLCLVSSKRYPGEFTEVKAEEAQKQIRKQGFSTIFVYDKKLWEIKPKGTYGEARFRLFIGDLARKPCLLPDDEVVPPEDEHLIVLVPIEFREEFENDILSAMRDIAGVSIRAMHPYIMEADKLAACFGKVPSILSRVDADFRLRVPMIHPARIANPEAPRYVHLDLGLTGDAAGFAVGHVASFREVRRGSSVDSPVEVLPVVRFDAVLRVLPPPNGEIIFDKIRLLLYRLRELGLPIKWVSADSWQSTDTLQLLTGQGFVTGMVSMDTSNVPYDVSKQAFYDGRVESPEHERAMQEWVRLNRDPKTGRIDHTAAFSKDCSDAMAGVIYGLTMRREIWHQHGVPLTTLPTSLQETMAKEGARQDKADLRRRISYGDSSEAEVLRPFVKEAA